MKHISIGGLDVSRIGLGAMSMAGYYNIGHTNEELVGRAIKDRRDKVALATKFGIVSHSGGGPGVLDSSPANIRVAVEGSLKRLGSRVPVRPGTVWSILDTPETHSLGPRAGSDLHEASPRDGGIREGRHSIDKSRAVSDLFGTLGRKHRWCVNYSILLNMNED
jgi:hypothetical protein